MTRTNLSCGVLVLDSLEGLFLPTAPHSHEVLAHDSVQEATALGVAQVALGRHITKLSIAEAINYISIIQYLVLDYAVRSIK